MAQVLPAKKPQFFEEKMLRLLEIFFLKNSSQFFLKPWRVRASNINILLIGPIKHYNFFYCHFLLRPFLSKIFAGPFHQAKALSSSFTVCCESLKYRAYLLTGICDCLLNQVHGKQFVRQDEKSTTKGRKGKTNICFRKWTNFPKPLISDQKIL